MNQPMGRHNQAVQEMGKQAKVAMGWGAMEDGNNDDMIIVI